MKLIISKYRPRVRSAERWHRKCKGRDTILQSLHHCSHRPPSIDPGSGQWRGGTENAKAEACQQEDALGKQWWRLAMQYTQHWVGQRGNNRNLSHVAVAPFSYHCHTSLSFAAPQDRSEKIK